MAGWKPQDLPKPDIWPIFSNNRKNWEKFWYAASIGLTFEESIIDWEDNASIDTAGREINDEHIKLLQVEDGEQEIGDGGSSDGEGNVYECVVSFLEGMKDVEIERLHRDADEIEHCIEANDEDAILCDKTSPKVSGLIGAPIGWSAHFPPANWNPTVNLSKGEPLFDDVDNPGGWNSFTFCPIFEKGHCVSHAMPVGATPVPMDVSGKRQSGGFESFYNGWMQENPTRENCRVGPTKTCCFLLTDRCNWMLST